MFDYIFKRGPGTLAEGNEAEGELKEDSQPTRTKEIALEQARALPGDESAVVEFILQCQFADARLIAADNLHSKTMLERALPAMRHADRRVAKLLQGRLDALAHDEQRRQLAQHCIDKALLLTKEPVLLLNQVVDLDHAWQAVDAPPAMRAIYDDARAVLREKLERQAGVQRCVIDAMTRLRTLSIPDCEVDPQDALAEIEGMEQSVAQELATDEAASLPKSLAAEFAAQHVQTKALLNARLRQFQAITATRTQLQEWEALNREELKLDELKRKWAALPALPDDATTAELQARFAAVLRTVAAADAVQAEPEPAVVATIDLSASLSALDAALREGSVRAALDIDKSLRTSISHHTRLTAGQSAKLAKMRSELNRLQAWAKWGGNISREELLKAAEGLQAAALPPAELAKKVAGLRDRWKSLDASGPAGKELWEKFDAACTLAYAPAAAHFKKLADERHDNLRKAEAIVAQVRHFAGETLGSNPTNEPIDWKTVAQTCNLHTQAWQRLGPIDRKDKKRLDSEFAQCLKSLREPLAAQQNGEVALREAMISEVLALNPVDRSTLDRLRALQDRWQHSAKNLPLERKQEQALWQRFRAACDGIFAKRKDAAAGADAERKLHLAEKETICARLESAVGAPAAAISAILRETKESWPKVGAVPRAAEGRIEARYQTAIGGLQKQLQSAKRDAADNEVKAMLAKLRICQTLERTFANGQTFDESLLEQWQALPQLTGALERPLGTRFNAVREAISSNDQTYRAVLEGNRDLLMQRLLRFEILAGVDSPPELSRERLQMQVDVLRSALKAGQTMNRQEALVELCKLASVADESAVKRVDRLMLSLSQDK